MGVKSDVIDAITKSLETIAPSVFGGADELANENATPSFAWEPTTIDVGNPTSIGDAPRSLHDASLFFDVRCHGADFDEAWDLFRGLATVVREWAEADVKIVGAKWETGSAGVDGTTLIATVTITVPVIEHEAIVKTGKARPTSISSRIP